MRKKVYKVFGTEYRAMALAILAELNRPGNPGD